MSYPLPIQRLTDEVSAAPQMDASQVTEVAAAGFKSIINNRPDFEFEDDQPTNASIEAEALKAGLAYRFLPVDGSYQSPEEAAQLADLLLELPKPILLFCRSGTRSTRLFMMAVQNLRERG